ncbi:MAG: selenocysteine-specific translation elongation factor [Chloroflexota bacterium]|nr:selenocysteine-specific translation elongation factor [Chloroflexota bacterium]
MFVVGTAGHVDHGKSVLVQALTGIDPDRLPEEKERGMTIDLGFAWLELPSGREVSIIDVPGHERFIKNMLAGVGGIDVALLVIAADEGVMPQTREHLAILDLLGVERGIVVITKKDLVEDDWLELVMLDVSEVMEGTTFAQAAVVPVSAMTGDGLDDLLARIDALLDDTPPKKNLDRPRLSVDRVFTVSGFGTVVTGTLIEGSLSAGQEVEILPTGGRYRVRGLQTHKRKVKEASPGARVAVNLSGIEAEELHRGDVLTVPGWLRPTRALDVKLRLISDIPRPLRHNMPITFHTGSAESFGKVRLLDNDKLDPGTTGWAQVILDEPIAVAKGDLFVIRSTQDTLGGGEIVTLHAKKHRRFREEVVQRLSVMEKGSPVETLFTTMQEKQPIELGALATRCNISLDEAKKAVDFLVAERRVMIISGKEAGALLMTTEGLQRVLLTTLSGYHRQFPLRSGMSKDELRSRLKLSSNLFPNVVEQLSQSGVIIEDGAVVRLPSHVIKMTKEQQASVDRFLKSLEQNPYAPPGDLLPDPDVLSSLIDQGKVVKVSDNVVFTSSIYEEIVQRIVAYIQDNGKINVGEVKDLLQTTRKFAVALLEYLDTKKITKRVGDDRVLN